MKNTEREYDVVIIGAGPSGLFCALQLSNSLKVLLIEKEAIPAQKLLLSAKGRGNITNCYAQGYSYFPHTSLADQALAHYTPSDFLMFLQRQHIAYHEEDCGRILLDQKVKPFHQRLCDQVSAKVEIWTQTEVFSLQKEWGWFYMGTSRGGIMTPKVIIATGSKSYPQLWSTSFALQIAAQWKIPYQEFYPALVGFETQQDISLLAGSSIMGHGMLLSEGKCLFQQDGPILFTHWGISGPVVFNASLRGGVQKKKNLMQFKITLPFSEMTKRLRGYLHQHEKGIPSTREISFVLDVVGVRSFEEAKVCGGGVLCEALDEQFQSVKVPGLFFIWESIHCTGKTGGFNLQRCRSSARCCAQGILKSQRWDD